MTVNLRYIDMAVTNPNDTRYTGFGYTTKFGSQQLDKITSLFPMKGKLGGSLIIELTGDADRTQGGVRRFAGMNIAGSVDLVTALGEQAGYPGVWGLTNNWATTVRGGNISGATYSDSTENGDEWTGPDYGVLDENHQMGTNPWDNGTGIADVATIAPMTALSTANVALALGGNSTSLEGGLIYSVTHNFENNIDSITLTAGDGTETVFNDSNKSGVIDGSPIAYWDNKVADPTSSAGVPYGNAVQASTTELAPDGTNTAVLWTSTIGVESGFLEPDITPGLLAGDWDRVYYVHAYAGGEQEFYVLSAGGSPTKAKGQINWKFDGNGEPQFQSLVPPADGYNKTDRGNGWWQIEMLMSGETDQATHLMTFAIDTVGGDGMYTWGSVIESGHIATDLVPDLLLTSTGKGFIGSFVGGFIGSFIGSFAK